MQTIEASSDKSREGFTLQKWAHLLRVIFSSRSTKALEAYETFGNVDFVRLWNSWKRGIILDIDECVAPHHGKILPENIDIIRRLFGAWWKIVVFSNMKKSNRYSEIEELGIRVITSDYAKPDIRWFLESCKTLDIPHEQAIMIGDNYLTDGGALSAGIDFIKIRPIETPEESRMLWRRVQILMRNLVDSIAQARGNLHYK